MDNLNSIMIYAFRYTLGRSTYAVTDVCEFIKENIRVLNKTDLKGNSQEIPLALADGLNWAKIK